MTACAQLLPVPEDNSLSADESKKLVISQQNLSYQHSKRHDNGGMYTVSVTPENEDQLKRHHRDLSCTRQWNFSQRRLERRLNVVERALTLGADHS
ncbi:Uncharacterized protein HZ326_15443 [Fusarium oxysporum f. sp. albedinis]|nr:Uncharacterized protein HZ326_15443 [Fusarium oxysporum f. sp. albedinis]